MEALSTVENLIALLTLTSLEIVLGIDNIVFIAILAARLSPEKQNLARKLGIGAAVGSRLLLVFFIAWIMGFNTELFSLFGRGFSGKDIILLLGGLYYCLAKGAGREAHQDLLSMLDFKLLNPPTFPKQHQHHSSNQCHHR